MRTTRPLLRRWIVAMIAACAMFVSICTAATNGTANEKPVVAQTLADFDRQAAAVRDGMQAGGTYSYIREEDKQRVEQRLTEMRQLLERHAGDAQLPQQDKVALLNAQEELNALLLQNDNNRLECEHGARTGSRIHVTSCHTHGELIERQRRDQGALGDLQRQPQTQLPSKDH